MELDAIWYTDEEWQGFVHRDGRRDLLDRHVFVTWVAGISHFPDAADLPDFAPGSDILLQPEPDNPFDSNAIGVWNANGTVQVGHLPAVIVHDLSRWPEKRHRLVVGDRIRRIRQKRHDLGIVSSRQRPTFERAYVPSHLDEERAIFRAGRPQGERGIRTVRHHWRSWHQASDGCSRNRLFLGLDPSEPVYA
jgi:hypothetical protein